MRQVNSPGGHPRSDTFVRGAAANGPEFAAARTPWDTAPFSRTRVPLPPRPGGRGRGDRRPVTENSPALTIATN